MFPQGKPLGLPGQRTQTLLPPFYFDVFSPSRWSLLSIENGCLFPMPVGEDDVPQDSQEEGG
jgi:hypothetical protein